MGGMGRGGDGGSDKNNHEGNNCSHEGVSNRNAFEGNVTPELCLGLGHLLYSIWLPLQHFLNHSYGLASVCSGFSPSAEGTGKSVHLKSPTGWPRGWAESINQQLSQMLRSWVTSGDIWIVRVANTYPKPLSISEWIQLSGDSGLHLWGCGNTMARNLLCTWRPRQPINLEFTQGKQALSSPKKAPES